MDIMKQERIEDMLQIKCAKHEKYPLDLIDISENSTNHQICYLCFQTSSVQKNQILNIRQILFAQHDSILQNFPPLKDQTLFNHLDELFTQQTQIDQSIKQIESFFEDFQQQLLSTLHNLQSSMKNKIEQLTNLKRNFIDTYNRISSKQELKSLFSQNITDRNQKLNEIITQKYQDQQNNTNTIKDLVDLFKGSKNIINLEGPLSIRETVFQLVKQINFFEDLESEKQIKEKVDEEISNSTQKTKSNVYLMSQLINNKTNYCGEQFRDEVQKLLKRYASLLNQVDLVQPYCDVEKRSAFQNLSELQLEQIRILAEKVQEVDEQYKSNHHRYEQQQSSKIQPNSYEIYNYLSSGNSNEYQNVQRVLRDYPILELESVYSCHQLLFMNFVKSKYADSQNLHIQKNQHLQIQISKINKKGHAVSYSCHKLDPNKKYILRLHIQSNSTTNNNLILFGLLPDSSKDIAYIRDTGLTYNERGDSCHTFRKIIKGDPIPEINKLSINKFIEVRIHLLQKFIRIASYPDYENISELDNKSRIQDSIEYRFAIELYQKDDKIEITEFMVVDDFDNKM